MPRSLASTGTTASAPSGIGAPVMIRIALSGSEIRAFGAARPGGRRQRAARPGDSSLAPDTSAAMTA